MFQEVKEGKNTTLNPFLDVDIQGKTLLEIEKKWGVYETRRV